MIVKFSGLNELKIFWEKIRSERIDSGGRVLAILRVTLWFS